MAAILFGPAVAVVVMSAVLIIQALVFSTRRANGPRGEHYLYRSYRFLYGLWRISLGDGPVTGIGVEG